MELQGLGSEIWQWIITSGVRVVVLAAVIYACYRLAKTVPYRIANRMKKTHDEEYQKRIDTLVGIVSLALGGLVLIIGGMIVLTELGVNIGPILASAGILGLAVGFGAQNLVQDIISGFFLLLEDQLRVGDVVEAGGKVGVVEKITLRMIIMRDLAGNVHYVRNGKVDIVSNMSKDFSRYVFDIPVAYRENVDEVVEQIKLVDEEMRQDEEYGQYILSPMEILGLNEFADSALVVRTRIATKPVMQWYVGREFNKRIKQRFDQVGIEIPYPHRTIYFGRDKEGYAEPMRVERVNAGDRGGNEQ